MVMNGAPTKLPLGIQLTKPRAIMHANTKIVTHIFTVTCFIYYCTFAFFSKAATALILSSASLPSSTFGVFGLSGLAKSK